MLKMLRFFASRLVRPVVRRKSSFPMNIFSFIGVSHVA